MAKTRSKSKTSQTERKKKSRTKTTANSFSSSSNTPTLSESTPEPLDSILLTATSLLRDSCDPIAALAEVHRALALYPTSLSAIELAAEINVDIGEIPTALQLFYNAVQLDPEGKHEDEGGSGPEKFLWLAQLCEGGGKEAVGWYEKGVEVLRGWIAECGIEGAREQRGAEMLVERGLKGKLCSALCGMAEIYMTDLCMEPDAESNCEKFVTEALLAVPDSSEALQTLASVRISQTRFDDAKAALSRSYELWRDLELDSPSIPPYATRMSFTRLLLECEMYDTAFEVLQRLQEEDDQIVDLWYLGGWCLYLQGEKKREEEEKEKGDSAGGKMMEKVVNGINSCSSSGNGHGEDNKGEEEDDWRSLWDAAREWLKNCARLYQALDWDDEQLRDHAIELLGNIDAVLGEEMEDDGEEGAAEGEEENADEDGAGWESVSDEDDVMQDS